MYVILKKKKEKKISIKRGNMSKIYNAEEMHVMACACSREIRNSTCKKPKKKLKDSSG